MTEAFAVVRAATTENPWLKRWRKLRLGARAKSAWWALMHRFHPKHRYNIVKTGLPPGYYDTDILMLHSWMALLVEHVEIGEGGEAKLTDVIAYLKQERAEALEADAEWRAPSQGQIHCDEEALAIYRWWKHERPLLWAKNEAYFDDYFERMAPLNEDERVAEAVRYHEEEEALHDMDDAMLARLIPIRRGLRT